MNYRVVTEIQIYLKMNSKRVKIDQDINPTILVDSIVEGIQEKKGTNIVVLDLFIFIF